MQTLFRTARGVFFLIAALLSPAQAFQAPDPFLPGPRWFRAASAQDPWIPGPVAFGADGETAVLLAAQGQRHAEVLSTDGEGAAAPIWRHDALQGSQGALGVLAPDPEGRFVSLTQWPAPGSSQRSTLVELLDPCAALLLQPPRVWSHTASLVANGPARMAIDDAGTRVVLAVCDPNSQRVDLDCLRLGDGVLLARRSISAPNLQGLALSGDGSTVALTLAGTLLVMPVLGARSWQTPIPAVAQAVALSYDGGTLALGGGDVRVYARQGMQYGLLATRAHTAPELCVRLALSPDAQTLALGWWDSVQTGVRLELLDLPSGNALWSRHQPHPGGALQNYPEAVCVSADGQRAAFALWGDGSAQPEFMLVDRQQGLMLAHDLPGSARGLALDARGQRVLLASKDLHANQFGSTGRVELLDTAERVLVQRSRAEPGQALKLAARRAGANIVFFLQGPPSPQPQVFPGALGQLLLVRSQLPVHPRPTAAQGRATLDLPTPADPLLLGTERYFPRPE
ncbi:MAG: WD40 repeat domain-containing protein, partial [Planctomycetia bacterium]